MLNKGLVLGGGGAKGIFQIGYLKGLRDSTGKDPFDNVKIISSTSIGTIITTLLLFNDWNLDIDYIEEFTKIIPLNKFNIYFKFIKGLFPFIIGLTDGILDNQKIIEKNLFDIIKNKTPNFKNISKLIYTTTKIQENSIASNIIKSENSINIDFKKTICKFATASSNLPILFKPYNLNGNFCYDGGLNENLPVSEMLNEKLDIIDIISLDTNDKIIIKKGFALFDTLLNLWVEIGDDWSEKDFINSLNNNNIKLNFIYPQKSLGSLINFSENNLRILFKLGYDFAFKK